MATEVASLFATLRLDNQGFTRDLNRSREGLRSLGGTLQSVGGQVTSVGAQMSAMTAPIIAVGGASVVAAAQWERGFVGVTKTVEGTTEELGLLEGQMRDLATGDSPVSSLAGAHNELTGLAEAAGQLGVQTENIDEFTEVMGMLGMTTNIVGEDGARSLAQFAVVAGFPLENIESLADAIVTLGNNNATTERDILNLSQRIATLASIDYGEDDILAFSTVLTSAGISAELGGTNFLKAANTLEIAAAQGGEGLNLLAETSGMTAESFQELADSDPAGAMQAFVEGLSELDRAGQVEVLDNLSLSGMEAQRVMLTLASNTDDLAATLDMASAAMAGNGALMEEAEKASKTLSGRFNTLMNNATDLGVTIGKVVLPQFKAMVTGTTGVVSSLNTFIQANPMLATTLITVGGAVAALGPALVALGTTITLVGTAVTGLAAGFAFLVSPIGLAMAAGVALTAAYMTNFGGLRDFIDGQVRPALMSFFNMMGNAWNAVAGGLTAFRDNVTGIFDTVTNKINQARNAVHELVQALSVAESAQGNISNAGTIGGALASGQVTPGQVGGALADAIGSQFGGGMAGGGTARAGMMYEVNEDGPEMLSTGGRDFLMMGGRGGRITPTNQLGGTTDNRQYTINVTQQPGESGEAFGERLMAKIRSAG